MKFRKAFSLLHNAGSCRLRAADSSGGTTDLCRVLCPGEGVAVVGAELDARLKLTIQHGLIGAVSVASQLERN